VAKGDRTRDRILTAAEDVVVRDGVARLTLEAAAVEAGLSKGGVLYHFPTRDALVTGMVRRLIEQFNEDLDEACDPASGPGARTRAYVRATFRPGTGPAPAREREDRLGAAIIAAMAAEPALLGPLREDFDHWQQQMVHDGLDPALATLVRLAADGLWLTELFGLAPLGPRLRGRVERELISLTEQAPGRAR
jgi:AcrR family transcriptional regulator